MALSQRALTAYADSKPHYQVLDGLRGVAALMVIAFHIFEAFATSPIDQKVNHGYLAVDFFFVLSGFVLGYAYDDRWQKMSLKDFFKRRLIRLHPLVVLGAVFGVITFVLQGSVQWNGTKVESLWIVVAFVFSILLIPALPGSSAEVRGNGEMFPLNGPSWSLFFEYVGNLLYALFIRRLSTRLLALLVVAAGAGLAYYAIGDLSGYGNLSVGWTLLGNNPLGGILRLVFSLSAGMLLSRVFKPIAVKGAFWKASLVIVVLLVMPYVGDAETMWLNGIYDTLVVVFVFPLLVWLGASDQSFGGRSKKLYRFLGDISYPVYIIHYPFMYLFFAWVWGEEPALSFAQAWPVAVLLFLGNIVLAYGVMRFYDVPLRRWLTKKFLQVKTRN